MDFLHSHKHLKKGDLVVVDCDHQCNVRLMDDTNFSRFRRGEEHEFYGGFYTHLPARLVVPSSGHWNVTLDLGNRQAKIKHAIRFVSTS